MRNRLGYAIILTAFAFATAPSAAARQQEKKPGHDHPQSGHAAEVDERGDRVMGFDHRKTTHHFRLKPDGGVIEVGANDPDDAESRGQIRRHLAHIAKKFAAGDFRAPMLIHGRVPPGVPSMKRLGRAIKYEYEETKAGALIRITTADAAARRAVHEFLRFQIEDHRTGDPTEPGPAS